MKPIRWHRRETRRQTENTNRFLRLGGGKRRKSAVSKPVPREGGQEGRYPRFTATHKTELAEAIVRATARPASDPDDPRTWAWVAATVWTDGRLAALGNGVRGGKWQ
jgi:hypothetical protein